jgi:hypothetical protein
MRGLCRLISWVMAWAPRRDRILCGQEPNARHLSSYIIIIIIIIIIIMLCDIYVNQ